MQQQNYAKSNHLSLKSSEFQGFDKLVVERNFQVYKTTEPRKNFAHVNKSWFTVIYNLYFHCLRGTILTWLSGTLINIALTLRPHVPCSTHAAVRILQVLTGGAISTGGRGTFINVHTVTRSLCIKPKTFILIQCELKLCA